MSIQQKLPLLMGGFLVVVIALSSFASYQAVKASSLDVSRQRLLALTQELAQLFEQSSKNEQKATHTLALDSAVRRFVASSGRTPQSPVLNALHKAGPRPEVTIRTEVLDANGTPMLSSIPGATLERHEELAGEITRASTGPDFTAIGRFRLIDDTLAYPSIAAIVEGNRPIGYVVRWRRVSATPQARDQLMGLLGTKASLFIGNDHGDVWTDFVGTAPKPPEGAKFAAGQIEQYSRVGGVPVVATTRPVNGVPWVVLVEFSRQSVMAPASAFLRRSVLIGLGIVILGMLVVWMISRSVTRPLTELTAAATALAAGDFSVAVKSSRTDELGTLSHAFNSMIGHVESAQQGLETKVRERTEQLRERNEELEAFGHSISHDLRAPLRAMHGFSQALLEDCGDQLGAVGTDYANRIAAGSRKMDALIQDLLAYSRVTRADMELSRVSLDDVAGEALSQLEADVASSGAVVNVAPTMPNVLANRVTLVQVVANLVANGLKFVPPGRTPSIQLRAVQSNGTTRLWIEDNGIGIDPTHHERVFGVFERLHQSEHYPGTGIGLAIVRKGIERMGGRVGVDSAVGQGSRFWIELSTAGAAS
jgi:signal transduction histidine kinase